VNVTFRSEFPKHRRAFVRTTVQELAHLFFLEHLWECNVRLTRARKACAFIKVVPDSHYAGLYLHADRLPNDQALRQDIAHELLHIPDVRLRMAIEQLSGTQQTVIDHFYEDYHDHVSRVICHLLWPGDAV
jgi:hypothetical protein